MLRQAKLSRSVAGALTVVLIASACSGGTESGGPPAGGAGSNVSATPTENEIEAPEPTVAPRPDEVDFVVQASINQLHVLEAEPGALVELVADNGTAVAGIIDYQGSLLWRDLAAGTYAVRSTGDGGATSDSVEVLDPDVVPDPGFYADQIIEAGFGYLTTRDGTTLSINVALPGGEGPFPTVVEYSGYDPSNPANATFASVFTTLGYAYVGVNMRGTGCSGGSFEFFEPVQLSDGYDMVEAIAAQPWVLHNSVGLVGISYPGLSQLFVASTQPPGLAAITPLSVLDDTTASTLYPGGILNTGFAGSWSDEREDDAQPYGQGWERGIVDGGDTTCAANQLVRLQNTDVGELIADNPFYTLALADPISPVLIVDRITVPVFLAGAWQDEQTGGHFPAMLGNFINAPHLFATVTNGTHTDALANLAIFERYIEFLDLYVARRTPNLGGASFVAPVLANALTGASNLGLPTGDRFEGMDYDDALSAYEQDPAVRVLFESGAADGHPPGTPLPRYEVGFDAWPPPQAELATWYLAPDGALRSDPVEGAADPSHYVSDPDSVPSTFYSGDSSGIWATDVAYDWLPIPEGTGVAWVTAPLPTDVVVVGFGSLDLWLRSSAADTDLEVTVTEVRPDGNEVYVQTGWLRASQRALDEANSRPNQPKHTRLELDAAPLPMGEFSEVRVEIFPFGHAFRAGSRLRVTVDAPGGARPTWAFDTTFPGGDTNEIAHDAERRSKLVLQVVPGIEVPADAPPCGAIRSQPCRNYVPFSY
jgi:predicted acyl esterase